MGDRHGVRFARRGRALNPPRPQVDAHRTVGFRWRATVLRCRGAVGRICPAREGSPRRRPPDTAHERKDLPRAGTLSSAKASRHGARAKGFVPRRNTPLGEGLPTRRTGERICPAREGSPRRRPPDTAHERKDLPRAGTRPSAKASRHGAKAKRFAPREKALLGEGLPTRRTSKRICPAREGSPRRRLPDTAHERRDLPRAGTRPSAKASQHGARAKGFARARTRPSAKASRHGARAKGFAPRGSPSPHVPTNGGTPSADGQPKNTPSARSHPQRAAAAEFIHRKK